MKTLNIIKPISDHLKLLALCIPLAWPMFAAAAPPVSGYSRWFDASQITGKANGDPVTIWNDLSTNAAHATVPSGNAAPVFVANAGTESGLPAVYFAKNNGAGDSAALRFTRDSAIRTVFAVFKGNSFLLTDDSAYDFHRPGDDNAAESLWTSYTSDNIKNGSTYVNGSLVTGTTYAMPTSLHNGFNLVEVLTTGNVQADSFNKDRIYHAGDQYHAEVIIYDRVLTNAERLSVETYLTAKWMPSTPQAQIINFGPGAMIGPVAANAAAVSWTVPFGTNVATLAPTFSLSSGATCTVNGTPPVSGETRNFTNPVHYIVKASDFATSGTFTDYTVTVAVTPASSAKDIVTFGPGGIISGTSIAWFVPFGTNVTALAPTYSVSNFASQDATFPSGTARNFTTPKTYTITAQDSTTRTYTVTVTVVPNETTLLWNIAGGGAWDLSTVNWKGQSSGVSMPFYNGKNVIFGNAAGGTINIVSGMAPASTTVSSGSYTFSGGPLAGTGSLTKSGSGTLTLNGANTYGGGTIVNTGSLSLGGTSNDLLGTGLVTVNSGATLNLNGNGNLTTSFAFDNATVTNGNSFSAYLNGPVALTNTTTIELYTTGNMTIGGIVSGGGGLTKKGTGAGPLFLTGANTFAGPVSIHAGTLSVASLNRVSGGTANSNLGAPTNATNGTISLGSTTTAATLMYSGPGETTDRVIKLAGTTGGATLSQAGTPSGITTTRGTSGLLKFTSNVSVPGSGTGDNRKTLTLTQVESSNTGTHPGTGEISGSIGDSLTGATGQRATSLTKAGLGTWTLSGSNTYSGATRVQAGTLALTRSDALGTGSLDITNGAKVQLDYIGTRQISALTFNAGAAKSNGTYGSSSSPATNKDDTLFAGPGTVTVGPIANATITTLALTSGTSPSNGGAALTFTATVTGPSPTGSVMFYDGLTLIGNGTLNGSNQASVTTSTLGAGPHSITALYMGAAGNSPSTSAALTQTVNETRPATTTSVALTAGGNPSNHNAAVTFTATVTGATPTSSVTFYNGSAILGSAVLNNSGLASLTTRSLTPGWSAITASYPGDAANAPSRSASSLIQTVNPPPGNGKLKVFILAGQSNMVGYGSVEDGRDPNNPTGASIPGGLGSLRHMLNANPNKFAYLADPGHPIAGGSPGWITRGDAWITYYGGSSWELSPNVSRRNGNLDANYGADAANGLIGPEYGFGLVVGSQLADQVLIIKYAHGGRSLAGDFRPPTSVLNSGGTVGPCYTDMIGAVHKVLNNIAAEFPSYSGGGYEIAGFGWHQGWNDRVTPGYVAEYEANLTNLIKDLRAEFSAPNMRVSIGNTGMANADSDANARNLILAQGNVADPTKHPEFAGTVATVDTRPFDYGGLSGVNDQGFHWYFNGESYFNIGETMGQAMMALLPPVNTLPVATPQSVTTPENTALPVTLTGSDPENSPLTYTIVTQPAHGTLSVSGPNVTYTPNAGYYGPDSFTFASNDGSYLSDAATVSITVTPSPFSTWAAANAGGQTAGEDYDNDGVKNGIEYFMGESGSSFTAMPGLNASNTVSWPMDPAYAGTYEVQTSPDLVTWTNVDPKPVPSGGSLTYTLPTGAPGGKSFLRLLVTPTP